MAQNTRNHTVFEYTDPDAARQAAGQQPAAKAGRIVAYRDPNNPRVLLCREHGERWAGVIPVTSEDLPDGGICAFGRLGSNECGRDILIPTPAVGQQPTQQPATDSSARDDLYDALNQSWYRWDPPGMAKGTGIIRLLDAYRAEILREAAEKIRQEVSDQWDRGNQDWDVHDAADLLSRLAGEAERNDT